MSSIIVEFEDKQLLLLKEKAKGMRLDSVEEMLQKIAIQLLDAEETDFKAVMQRVLEKNRELYKRLS